MSRTRAERRHNDWAKAIRKRKIVRDVYYSYEHSFWDFYDNLHQYSKNKIHCSCPICSEKTKNRQRYGKFFNPSVGWRRRMDEMEYEINEEIG